MEMSNFDKEISAVVLEGLRLGPEFTEFVKLSGAGIPPDRERARSIGMQMAQVGNRHKALLDALERSKDFQALEGFYTMEAMARRANAPSLRTVQLFVKWQADGLLAIADARPPPPLPLGLNPESFQAPGESGPSTMGINVDRSLPFDEECFDAGVSSAEKRILKSSFLQLAKEHRQLVGLGETYGDFDPAGKEFYLGQMGQMSFRWEDLMERALEAGVPLTPAFKAMSRTYLARANLSPDEFRQLMDDIHAMLRQLVNKEKGVGV